MQSDQQYQEVDVCNVDSETYITDQVGYAASILNKTEIGHEKYNYYNTFDTLMTTQEQHETSGMNQAWKKIIVDTGCIETVCGKEWLQDILDSMDIQTRKLVRVHASKKIFRFGGGERKQSLGEYIIPISTGGKKIFSKRRKSFSSMCSLNFPPDKESTGYCHDSVVSAGVTTVSAIS